MPGVDDFGVELRRRRVASHLSLRGLARLVHYDASYLSRVEAGKRRAGPALARLCDDVLAAGGALAALASAEPLHVAQMGEEIGGGPALSIPWTIADDPTSRHSLRLLFRHLRELGQQTAPDAVLPTVITQARIVSLLASAAAEKARRELYELAAHYAEYVGWMLQEQGDQHGTLTWTMRAVDLDALAGRADMAAYALVRRAELAMYSGRPDHAAALAAQAQQAVGVNPRIRSLAAQREAQGHALAGDRARCEAALARSAEWWAHCSVRQHRSDLFGSSSVPDLNAMVAAWCAVDLGRPGEAAEQITAVLATLPGNARRARTMLGARLAVAYALGGELDSSCAVAARLIVDARALHSATTHFQLRRLSSALARWPRNQVAAETRAELNGLLRAGRVLALATDNS